MIFDKGLFVEKPKIRLSSKQVREISDLKDKILVHEYSYEEINCPCCEVKDKILLSQYDRYGLFYPANICVNCGLIYVSPRFDLKSYEAFYNGPYRVIYSKFPLIQSKEEFYQKQIAKGLKIFKFIEDYYNLSNINSVLEVGCGMGGILVPFKKQGFQTFGVDFGEDYIEYGKTKGLCVQVGSIKDIDERYDLIIYSHVFEHILDLNSELEEIKKRLTPNGILYIEVPGVLNLKGYRYNLCRYFQNAHTYNFSLITLKNILGNVGFTIIYGNEKIESIFKVDTSSKSEKHTNDFQRIIQELKRNKVRKILWPITRTGLFYYIKLLLIKLGIFKFSRRIYKSIIP